MRLKNVTALNLMGSSFEQSLAAFNHFHGPNMAGKTTRATAVTLALCHQIPGVAVRASDIHRLYASGSTMSVYVENDEAAPQFAGAAWEVGRKGTINTAFEGSLEAPTLLFSAKEFLDLSPDKRTNFLFSVLPPPPLAANLVETITAKIKNIKLDPHTAAAEKAINELCDWVRDDFAAPTGEVTPQQWLQELVESAADRAKEAKAAAKTMRQTALGSTALATDAPALGPVEERQRKTQEAFNKALTAEEAARGAWERAQSERNAAKKVVEAWQSLAEDPVPGLTKEKTDLEGAIDGLERSVLAYDASETKSAYAALATQVNAARLNVEEAYRQLNEFEQLECCPTCKAKAKGWKVTVLASLNAAHTTARNEYNRLLPLEAAALQAKQEAEGFAQAAALRATTLRNNRTRLSEVETNLQKHAAKTEEGRKVAELSDKLPTLVEAVTQASARHDEARQKREAARDAMNEAAAAHRVAIAAAANAKQATEAGEKAAESEVVAEVTGQLRELLTALLRECVEQSISPLVELCNDLCLEILPGRLVFSEGEIKMVGLPTQQLHSHETFSGTEKALVHAAISIALSTLAPIKLLILDELDRLDDLNKTKVVARLLELLQAKKIDQVITIGTRPLPLPECLKLANPELMPQQIEVTK